MRVSRGIKSIAVALGIALSASMVSAEGAVATPAPTRVTTIAPVAAPTVAPTAAPATVLPTRGRPRQTAPKHFKIKFHKLYMHLTWQKVKGARRYYVEVRPCTHWKVWTFRMHRRGQVHYWTRHYHWAYRGCSRSTTHTRMDIKFTDVPRYIGSPIVFSLRANNSYDRFARRDSHYDGDTRHYTAYNKWHTCWISYIGRKHYQTCKATRKGMKKMVNAAESSNIHLANALCGFLAEGGTLPVVACGVANWAVIKHMRKVLEKIHEQGRCVKTRTPIRHWKEFLTGRGDEGEPHYINVRCDR